MKMRLDKLLSSNGQGSRSSVKKMLHKKICMVNGIRVTSASFGLDPEKDEVTIDGEKFIFKKYIYLMLNKPAGCVTSTSDPIYPTVMDFLHEPFSSMKLFPAGRLDLDTEGLVIITNDGEAAHRLISPKSGIVKKYYIEFSQEVENSQFDAYVQKLKEGITLQNGYKCKPAYFEKHKPFTIEGRQGFVLGITEGKYHQVKKMCCALGNELTYLKRLSMGSVVLDKNLKHGEYREFSNEEIKKMEELKSFG